MKKSGDFKSQRLMYIYMQLEKGRILNRAALAREYGVSERSIQRDMEALRGILAEQSLSQEIVLDREANGYRLVSGPSVALRNSELLAVVKILLESRSLRQDEMLPIVDKLVRCCVPPENQEAVRNLIANEKFHYIGPRHHQPLVDRIWALGQAINRCEVLEITYQKLKGQETVTRLLEPVGLMFSEFYFYLVGFIRDIDRQAAFENPDDCFPTIYRVDRLQDFHTTGETFTPPYASRFQEGEFRKRIQFMFGGKLRTVRFRYSGPSIEAVLDRLPTAEILSEENGVYTVRAEVFGKGIDMWLRSQGEYVEKIS